VVARKLNEERTDCRFQHITDYLSESMRWRFCHSLALDPKPPFLKWHAMFAIFPFDISISGAFKSKRLESGSKRQRA
jgi:hypothetical protein